MASQWQRALNLENEHLQTLQLNFVVCTRHFSSKCYRNAISNSLNTTAIPNMEANDDNERIETTRTRNKSKDVPTRCHKSPKSLKHPFHHIFIQNIDQSAKKPKLDYEVVRVDQSALENDDPQIVEDLQFEEESHLLRSSPDFISISKDQHSQTHIDKDEKGTQTEKTQESTAKCVTPTDSKDDKLITLLYPDFSGKNKIDLIKMINERNQRIKSLEEEKQLLEDAMRKLL